MSAERGATLAGAGLLWYPIIVWGTYAVRGTWGRAGDEAHAVRCLKCTWEIVLISARRYYAIVAIAAAALALAQRPALAAEATCFTVGGAKYGVLPAKLSDQYNLSLTVTPLSRPAAPAPAKPAKAVPPVKPAAAPSQATKGKAKAPAKAAPPVKPAAAPPQAAKGKAKAPAKPAKAAPPVETASKPEPKPAKPAPAPPRLRVLFSVVDAKNHYELTLEPKAYALSKVVAGKSTPLVAGVLKSALAEPYHILVKRRQALLTAAVNGQVLAECMDSTFAAGTAALEVTQGVPKLSECKAQKCGAVHDADDFMVAIDADAALASVKERTAVLPSVDLTALTGWDKASGDWRLFSVLDEVREVADELLQERIAISNSKPDAARSANPFSLSGKAANGEGIVLRGHAFWDDYVCAASANSSGSQFGLIFYYQSANDYFIFEWAAASVRERSQPLRLVRVHPKGRDVVASTHAASNIDQWYRLGVETYGQRIQCYLDGHRVFDVSRPDAIGGRMGLLVRGPEPTHFDDVTLDTTRRRRLDSAAAIERYAACDKAHWAVQGPPSKPAEAHTKVASPSPLSFGSKDWSAHRLAATVRCPAALATAGLQVGPVECQWAGTVMRLTLRAQGKATTLAAASVALPLHGSRRLALDLTKPPHAQVYVDGVLELQARLPAAVSGRCGLLAGGAAGVTFSDIEVSFERDEDRERPVSNAIFTEDPYMLHWSSPQGAWVPLSGSKSRFWHKGDFFGAFSLSVPFAHGTQLLFCTSRTKPGSDLSAEFEPSRGYALTFDSFQQTLRFDRMGQSVKTMALPSGMAAPAQVTVAKNGKYVWISAGKHELMEYRDASPPSGRRVALVTGGEVDADYFAGVTVERGHVRDDYFDRAPVDWHKVGKWEVINRFACDPRWSHMTAWAQDDMAVLWTKAGYEGDFTLEFYAGNKMWPMREWVGAQYYPRVGDINATVCADGRDLDSGYTVTLAEWDNQWSETWTRLRRGTTVVAQSDRELVPRNRELYPSQRVIPVPWIKKGRGIHGAWYYIKLRKIGSRIEYYFDNELVLSYTDPRPLKGRRIAIWTQDNYVTFARAKISYQTRAVPTPIAQPPKETAPAGAVERFTGVETAGHTVVNSSTHPGASFDFEGSFNGWSNMGEAQGALLEVDPSTRATGRSSLRVTNIETGGHFGLRVPVQALSLADATLSFHYCMGPDAKVNFYFKFDDEFDRWHFVEFTGGAPQDSRLVCLGSISRPRADGRWHSAQFELGQALRQARPLDPELRPRETRIGYFHEGYLRAGLGGNHRGTTYHLDAFQMLSPGPPQATFFLQPSRGAAKGYSTALSQSSNFDPPQTITTTAPSVTAQAARRGRWFLHARACDAQGQWTPTTHYALDVVTEPVMVHSIRPQSGAAWGGAPIYLSFQPRNGPDLSLDTLRLTANGKHLDPVGEALKYDCRSRLLTIHADQTRLHFADGERVQFALDAFTSNGQNVSAEWAYTMRHSADNSPPTHCRLLNYPAQFDFETHTHGAAPLDGLKGALLRLDRRDRRGHEMALNGVNLHMGGSAGVLLLQDWVSLGRCPVLSFDYRVPKTYRLNLLLDPDGQSKIVQLTDVEKRAKSILGKVENAEADNTWRHAELNMASLLRATAFGPDSYSVSHIALSDTGYQGVGPNMEFQVDNFALVPTVSGQMGVRLRWDAHDVSGIGTFCYRWSRRPSDSPYQQLPGALTEKIFYANAERELQQEGDVYFHLSAQDNRGRRSRARHYRFIVDNTAPQWGTPEPAPGSRSASTTVTIPLTEGGSGVDVSALQFALNGRVFEFDGDTLSLDIKAGKVKWDWSKALPAMSFGNAATVQCALDGVRDFAGNLSPRAEWSWTVDFAQDTTPPQVPHIDAAKHPTLTRDTFEQGLGEWMSMAPLYYYTGVSRTKRTTSPDNYCVQVYNSHSRGNFGAYARATPFRPMDFPILSFDYCLKQGVKVDLMLQIAGEFYIIKLSAPDAQHKVIGRISGFSADYRWHTAWIDLRPMLRKALPKRKDVVVEAVAFGDFGENHNARRSFYRIDNFTIAGAGASQAEFRWHSSDFTGIKAYRAIVDHMPETEPASAPAANVTRLAKSLMPGMWYLHVKAQDGAGNWGPTAHYPYYVDSAAAIPNAP